MRGTPKAQRTPKETQRNPVLRRFGIDLEFVRHRFGLEFGSISHCENTRKSERRARVGSKMEKGRRSFSRSRTPRPRRRRENVPDVDDADRQYRFRYRIVTPDFEWAWSQSTQLWYYRRTGSYIWHPELRQWVLEEGVWRLRRPVNFRGPVLCGCVCVCLCVCA